MGSTSQYFQLPVPAIAGDNNTWGIELNSATVGIDALLYKLATGQLNTVADTSGAAGAIVAVLPFTLQAYVLGLPVSVVLNNTVNGPTTINLNGLGAVPFRHTDLTELAPLDGLKNQIVTAVYDGTQFQYTSYPQAGRVPVGTVLAQSADLGLNPITTGYLLANGQAVSRTTYGSLFALYASAAAGSTITNGSNTVTVPSGVYSASANGKYISGPGIPVGTTVTAVNGAAYTYTMSNNATASSVATIYTSLYMLGDGATTFNLPNYYDRTLVGAGNSYALGYYLGEAAHTLTVPELPAHNHGVYDPTHYHQDYGRSVAIQLGSTAIVDQVQAQTFGNTQGASTGISVNSTGSGSAHNNIQPSATVFYLIKY